jgi:hypothetical protein
MPRYKVMVDDNFNYMDEDERHEQGTYDTVEEALAACRAIVEKSVKDQLEPGMLAEELFKRYQSFGDDPFILVVDGKNEDAKFSAWSYAQEVCATICAEHR